jgi:hypothetical protein
VKNQLFQLDGKLYEQTDGVAMGSPLGPLMASTFMCSIEQKLVNNMDISSFYHRFVNDTITSQRSLATAEDFLGTLNSCHESLNFTMECEVDGKLPFLGMEAIRKDDHLETKVYVHETNQHWSPSTLPESCGSKIQTFTYNHYVKPCIPFVVIMGTLCRGM